MDKLTPQEMNSVHDLVVASKQQDAPKNEKAFYFARRPSDLHEHEDEEPANSSVRTLVKKRRRATRAEGLKNDVFIVQASVRKLVFNDKECCIVILKNLTSAFRFRKASDQKENMEMLTTTVSHEMRLPLKSVITMCRILLSWTSEEKFIELIKSIMSANKILLCRVNDLLDLSTLDRGTFSKNEKVFDLLESITEVISINEQQALFKENRIGIFEESELARFVRADNTRMQQILMSYIGNAMKFTSKGQIDVFVKFEKDRTEANAGLVEFEVRDTGCGMSQQDKAKLFVPFTMLSANKNLNPNGTGMGLSICKRIAESMNGAVWVDS